MKFAISGVTGQVGGVIALALLEDGHAVRAIVRNAAKGDVWARQGCEVAVVVDAGSPTLTNAFEGMDGVFAMIPPDYDPEPGFPKVHALAANYVAAAEAARPGKVVYLSTIGAHVTEPNLLNNAGIMEKVLGASTVPVAMLRPAWFMENARWDIDAARIGVVPSFLQPLDHEIPMVATVDIGRTAARLLLDTWTGKRVVELEGPRRYAANDIAAAFAGALGHPVRMEALPRDTWEGLMRTQGMRNPTPRMRMVDGFNEGWIDFEGEAWKAATTLETVLAGLVAR